ncbi:hypothetical protein [Glutamicibacter protophormiae]|uniref:hypothetical protein n=2 Tax=Glutamicibacter protophormiae TaxID=37930 RepID=UPI0033230500
MTRMLPQSGWRGMALLAACLIVGVPLALAAVIGVVVLGDRVGIGIPANEAFAWIVSLITAVLMWPLVLRGMRRYFMGLSAVRAGEGSRLGLQDASRGASG